MKVVYIHGANSSSKSFDFIDEALGVDCIKLDYKSPNGFYKNLSRMKKELAGEDQLFFVGHSLGGIYSMHLANEFRSRTLGGLTIATPHGGSGLAELGKFFFPGYQLYRDVGIRSRPITDALSMKPVGEWSNIVTLRGYNPFYVVRNDGVVTFASMTVRDDFEYHYVTENHYLIMNADRTVELIRSELEKFTKPESGDK